MPGGSDIPGRLHALARLLRLAPRADESAALRSSGPSTSSSASSHAAAP